MNSLPRLLLRAVTLALTVTVYPAETAVRLDDLAAAFPSAGAMIESGDLLKPLSTVERRDRAESDYLFARPKRGLMTALTGIPYVALTEYAYGFTERFTVGVLAGLIANGTVGIGVRPRYIVTQPSENFRVHVKGPLIYYPDANGVKNWWLAWPTVNTEWRLPSGTRLWAGAGAVGTTGGVASVVKASSTPAGLSTSAAPARRYGASYGSSSYGSRAHSYPSKAPAKTMYGNDSTGSAVWNTLHLGLAKPISSRLTFQFEAAAVMKGLKLDSTSWVAGPPVILTTGLSYSF